MFHIAKSAWPGLLAGILLVSACSGPKASSTPTPDAGAQLTSVASTVQAELTQVAALTPSATATQAPTDTQSVPTEVIPTLPLTTEAPANTPTATVSALPDKAQYISQSIADNTKMEKGKEFTMSWKVKNVGTTTWTTKYHVRFFAGNTLGADNSVAFPKEVAPGDEADISVKMKAPSSSGSYRSTWVLTNADGINFFGPIYLDLVVGDAPTATKTSVPAATNTSAPAATNTSAPAATNTPAPPTATTAPTSADAP